MTPPRDDSGLCFACDVGNSRVALAIVQDGRLQRVVRIPHAALAGLADVLAADPSSAQLSAAPVVTSSVNPAAVREVRTLVARITRGPFLLAREDFPIPILTAVDAPDRVGMDRLLAALAAHQETKSATIIVNVGTALTVDAVDADGRFLGGAILPGPTLAARSLHANTAALPEVPLAAEAAPPDAVGRNTDAAIRAGIVLGTAGAVERLVAEQRRRIGAKTPVVATGGGLDVLRPALSVVDTVRPDLVLEGLVAAYLARP